VQTTRDRALQLLRRLGATVVYAPCGPDRAGGTFKLSLIYNTDRTLFGVVGLLLVQMAVKAWDEYSIARVQVG